MLVNARIYLEIMDFVLRARRSRTNINLYFMYSKKITKKCLENKDLKWEYFQGKYLIQGETKRKRNECINKLSKRLNLGFKLEINLD